MKIATVAYLHGFGGAEKQISMLANALAGMGHEVTMIVLAEFNRCYPISDYVKILDLTSTEENKGKAIITRFTAFRKALKELKPEVTIHFNFQSAYFCDLIPSKYTGKVIYSERGDPCDGEYSGLMGIVRKLTLPRLDGFVFQSEGARDFFNSSIRERSTVIHNPVSITKGQYQLPEHREKIIISVGRLHPQKNQKLLIDAFAKVNEKHKDYKLVIYGDGDLKKSLVQQIASLKLVGAVEIHSSQKGIYDIIRTASMFVLSSDYEGMPNVLLEAMALGVPCVSTDCRPGGARALIIDGFNGYITPIGDANILAEKMNHIIEDSTVSKFFIQSCRDIIDTHTPEAIFGQWEKYLKRITT